LKQYLGGSARFHRSGLLANACQKTTGALLGFGLCQNCLQVAPHLGFATHRVQIVLRHFVVSPSCISARRERMPLKKSRLPASCGT